MTFWTRIPDDVYVANLRRSLAQWDRWRLGLIPFHVGLIVTVTWVFFRAIPVLLMGLVQPANAPLALLGFVTGTVMGMIYGWIIYGLLHALNSALGGFRTERLLLEHLDAHDLQQCEVEQQRDNNSCGGLKA